MYRNKQTLPMAAAPAVLLSVVEIRESDMLTVSPNIAFFLFYFDDMGTRYATHLLLVSNETKSV